MKPIVLSKKELDRADLTNPKYPFTIIARRQEDGKIWVAAINLNTRLPFSKDTTGLGTKFVEDKTGIPVALREIGRDLTKFLGLRSDMADKMRHPRENKQYVWKLGSSEVKMKTEDRSALIRLASSLPKGDETRKAILSGLSKTSGVPK